MGYHIEDYIEDKIRNSAALIVSVPFREGNYAFIEREVLFAKQAGTAVIPVRSSWYTPNNLEYLEQFKGFDFRHEEAKLNFRVAIAEFIKQRTSYSSLVEVRQSSNNFKVDHISISNIRSIQNLNLKLSSSNFTVFLGDNSVGKSTLLRALSIGLASASDATAMLKELPGPFIRNGSEDAEIVIDLADSTGQTFKITTKLSRNSDQSEQIEKSSEPSPFPWEDLFLCGYGTNRSREATNSFERYTVHSAVQALFDDSARLQNPELILLRQSPSDRKALERSLLAVLMLEENSEEISYTGSGPELGGPWGNQPLRNLSDGYRSTAQWILDFLHWAILAKRLQPDGTVDGGILILDELEQHLHPRWQRHIVQRLAKQFPTTQIFTSTHTPLVAAGVADLENANLIRLIQDDSGDVTAIHIDPQSLRGKRADQILASEAFGLLSTRNLGSELDTERYAILLGMKSRGAEEEQELQRLRERFDSSLRTEESPLAQDVEKALDEVLKTKLSSVDPKLLDVEVKRQIQDLFSDATAEPSAR